jgi:hypothetical protein
MATLIAILVSLMPIWLSDFFKLHAVANWPGGNAFSLPYLNRNGGSTDSKLG